MAMECSRALAVTIEPVAELDDASFLLLHEIRLRGVVAVGDDPRAAELVARGFVVESARGVRVTPAGRELHTSWARLLEGSDEEQAVQRAYARFLPLNRELLRICHEWQLKPGDWSVLDRARALDERIGPLVNGVSKRVVRFTTYRPQLRAALVHIDEGANEWMTSPRCDSYHTVWMRLHEDLLLALGTERSSEPEPTS
jgi:hypothetical protein